ncbi:hypothetical protein K0M31_016839 [Melipona bicolor]|uniref:Uncharacterized protein n=1 Tax=Melipona bicolor TaxID=60889 RepID=A0AA40KEN7_9HYME|nr:hypothetical protein K0M31_016839 [Melipona bicolor]
MPQQRFHCGDSKNHLPDLTSDVCRLLSYRSLNGLARDSDWKRKSDKEDKELERSYTLSTPGGSSPVCCPPCSPPPAPAAYISSARASSRRLAAATGIGGPPSPERDPLGRLLRFLKSFYRELGTRDPPHLPGWASPLPLGTLCPAHFQPHLQLLHKGEQEHRLENIKPDQIFAPVRVSAVNHPARRAKLETPTSEQSSKFGCTFLRETSIPPGIRVKFKWSDRGEGTRVARRRKFFEYGHTGSTRQSHSTRQSRRRLQICMISTT